MRFVIYGAGAVGGVVGARLFESGQDVRLIARGRHYEAIRERGLRLEDPGGSRVLAVPVVQKPDELEFGEGDVVLLTMKSQHTAQALEALEGTAPPTTPILCLQNGVDNERQALRRFPLVYGVRVMALVSHLEPGVVRAHSAPRTGAFVLGRYPRGRDELADAMAAAFRAASFDVDVSDDVMPWKYSKLLLNLGNAVEAACGPAARGGALNRLAREEGVGCLRAAGIAFVDDEAGGGRRAPAPAQPATRLGGSSWQSLQRSAGSIETDYLNGEIVLLGRLHGVPTPANELLQGLTTRMAAGLEPPGSYREEDLLARLDAGAPQASR